MGDTAFGESFKLMDRKTEDYCYKTTARFLPMLSVFSPIHWVFPFMTRIPILNREINEFDKFEDALFWKRLRSEPREPDVFQWIASEYREKPSPTQQETTNMKADVGLIVIAGSETTRLTLTTLLYNLVCHPRVFRKLQEEVDTLMRHKRSRKPKPSRAQSLPSSSTSKPASTSRSASSTPPCPAFSARRPRRAGSRARASSWR